MTDAHVIEVEGLTHRFGRREVLRDVTLRVEDGSVTALLGRNGVGKSTLMKILVGFQPPTAGRVRVLGIDPVRKGHEVRRRVGFVPERLELPRWMSIRDHLRFLEPFYPTWDAGEALRLLGALGLDAAAKVHTLSKGERAKHALVAALAHRPRLLLLDEPFSGLDPIVRHEVLSAVMGHLREDGRTVVLVSHSMNDVERLADRIVLLDQGRVRIDAELEELQRRAVRVLVSLGSDAQRWLPPGDPRIERRGQDVVLTYLEWDETTAASLHADPAVESVQVLPRDLGDVFVAGVARPEQEEETPCAAF